MTKNECYLCSSENHKKREGKVRNHSNVAVLECENCSLVFLSSFAHINKEFYKKGVMHLGADSYKWQEITHNDDLRRFIFLNKKNKIKNSAILDFGAGNAAFLMLSKPTANKVVGLEIDETVKEYYKENDIEFISELSQTESKFDLITMFHVLEHLPDPKETLQEMTSKLKENGELIIEVPNSKDALITVFNNKGFKNFTYWGCHLFLFNEGTLKKLFEDSPYKINCIKHVQRYGVANHLHWLIKNLPNGHNIWKKLDIKPLNKIYEKILSFFKITDTIVISVSLK